VVALEAAAGWAFTDQGASRGEERVIGEGDSNQGKPEPTRPVNRR